MTSLQNGKALHSKAIHVVVVNDEGNLNDTFIEWMDESIRYSLRHHW